MEARIGLRLEREESALHLANGRIAASTGSAEGADAMISGEPPVVAAIYGGQLLEALVASGALRIEGDRGPVRRFVTLFLLPPKHPLDLPIMGSPICQGEQGSPP